MNLLVVLLIFLKLLSSEGSVSKPSCGAKSSSKAIQLINPEHPPSKCVYHVRAYSKATYQLRLDFTMTLAQPTLPNATNNLPHPVCNIDYVTIGELKFCGIETSQHIYVPFPSNSNEIEITFVTAQRYVEGGLPQVAWDFSIHQLEWSDLLRGDENLTGDWMKTKTPPAAPIGCFQYFTHRSEIITSFNYNSGYGVYPNGMNYAICIRRHLQTTGLKIKMRNFKIGSEPSTQVRFDDECYSRNNSDEKSYAGDYLLIPQAAIVGSGNRLAYICGYSSTGVTIMSTSPGPLVLIFNSDTIFMEGTTRQGFSMTYSLV